MDALVSLAAVLQLLYRIAIVLGRLSKGLDRKSIINNIVIITVISFLSVFYIHIQVHMYICIYIYIYLYSHIHVLWGSS